MTDRDAPSGTKTLWKDETCHIYSIAAATQRDADVLCHTDRAPPLNLERYRPDLRTLNCTLSRK